MKKDLTTKEFQLKIAEASTEGGFDQWVDECREIANADT